MEVSPGLAEQQSLLVLSQMHLGLASSCGHWAICFPLWREPPIQRGGIRANEDAKFVSTDSQWQGLSPQPVGSRERHTCMLGESQMNSSIIKSSNERQTQTISSPGSIWPRDPAGDRGRDLVLILGSSWEPELPMCASHPLGKQACASPGRGSVPTLVFLPSLTHWLLRTVSENTVGW